MEDVKKVVEDLEFKLGQYDGIFADMLDRIKSLEEEFERPTVRFKKLSPNAVIPRYQTDGAAGLDLVACGSMLLDSKSVIVVPTGLAIELPPGYEAQVRSRSGLSAKGIVVGNSPGTIDEDYRGEIKVILHNHRGSSYEISEGDRIAQLVITRVAQAEVVEAVELSETERGAGGLGSTGK